MQTAMLQKIQEMEERRIGRIGESVKTYAELDRQVIPIIGKCLDGIVKAAESIDPKNVSTGVWTSCMTQCWWSSYFPAPSLGATFNHLKAVAFRATSTWQQ